MGEPAEPATADPEEKKTSRAGRNLPAAIGVGAGLGAVIVAVLLLAPRGWVGIVAVAVGLAIWELYKRLRQQGVYLPLIPMVIGGPATVLASLPFGITGVFTGFAVTTVTCMMWCLLRNGLSGKPENYVCDSAITLFVATWVILFTSVGALLVLTEKGAGPIWVLMIGVICSDVGGYTAGVLFGKHPMVPRISPKKSWEGFAGSMIAGIIGSILTVTLILGEHPLIGALIGAALVVFGTIGDLIESQFKRDLGIKDMGTLLPGHGGLMDRLDSLVVAAVVLWVFVMLLGYPLTV
ncbi:phosphatidate cytidylyltransferase [Hoyosella sp. G463]|uniref:Phosphatidate cytidylyltransferase n=1 Tax=Lolliginicoccus lacisalsi TaxID=2742202 RepID=A0A927PLL0_9ACTN|nr:phosphatidate cytidylyltransferase [Lolliginicoccus lacisalsi]MBD8505492.1 phosphatidate cytidylyltransferase [Lolliginicoccus lacisalsi]